MSLNEWTENKMWNLHCLLRGVVSGPAVHPRVVRPAGSQDPAPVASWKDANQKDAAAGTCCLPKCPTHGGLRSGMNKIIACVSQIIKSWLGSPRILVIFFFSLGVYFPLFFFLFGLYFSFWLLKKNQTNNKNQDQKHSKNFCQGVQSKYIFISVVHGCFHSHGPNILWTGEDSVKLNESRSSQHFAHSF